MLELKNRFKTEDITRMVGEIRNLEYLENVIFISFHPENCVDLRALLPDATIQFLTMETMSDKLINLLIAHKLDLDIYYPRISEEWVAKLHSLGIKVNVWTCDSKEDAENLVDLGVDFITSNILE